MIIFTVHTLGTPSPQYGTPRTPGYFPTLELAQQCVEKNWGDIYETSYRYAVIEEFPDGLYTMPKNEWWYEWQGDYETGKYVACEKPDEFKGIISFGIG